MFSFSKLFICGIGKKHEKTEFLLKASLSRFGSDYYSWFGPSSASTDDTYTPTTLQL